MYFYSKTIRKFLKKWPGEKYFGVYRFLPLFFFAGAGLEYVMINWRVGEVNFYNTYKRTQVQEIADRRMLEDQSLKNQDNLKN
ncbi:small integral membrane protein 4 [Cotesia glomerata]|uniref:small integral membrane protein 4 n=1 Tax=Cotesia glomerata TaxID=32391 RepID=UPI001D0276BF|nr:small integral membrane protein 4 [Cotesia glomerata]